MAWLRGKDLNLRPLGMSLIYVSSCGTQAESGQQAKDGVIAAAGGDLTVAGTKDTFNLIGELALG